MLIYFLRNPDEYTGARNPDDHTTSGEPAHAPGPLVPAVVLGVPMAPEQEIIVISDDDEEVPAAVIAARRKQRKRQKRLAAVARAIRAIRRKQKQREVIEVSSDDDAFNFPSQIRIGPPSRTRIRRKTRKQKQ